MVNATNIGSIDNLGSNMTIATFGCAEHHLPTTGNLGRKTQHQNRGEKRCTAARDVKPHTLNGDGTLQATHTGAGFDVDSGRPLSRMESRDVFGCLGYGLLHFGRYLGCQGFTLVGGEFQGLEVCTVKLQGIVSQGLVAGLTDVGHNGFDTGFNLFVVGDVSYGQCVPLVAGRAMEYLHKLKFEPEADSVI